MFIYSTDFISQQIYIAIPITALETPPWSDRVSIEFIHIYKQSYITYVQYAVCIWFSKVFTIPIICFPCTCFSTFIQTQIDHFTVHKDNL